MGRSPGAHSAGSSTFPFGEWQVLRANFLAAASRSALTARQLERSGRTAAEVTASPADWRTLRPITKADLIEDQQIAAPYGTRCCVAASELGLVVESSGSTGQGREVHYLSRPDTARTASGWASYIEQMGVTPADVVALCFPVGMAGGGVRHLMAYTELGATVLRVGGLTTERKIEAIGFYGATTIVATPAYVDRLGVVAEECGIHPSELGIRRLVVATQSVSVAWVHATEALWGAKLHEWYGTSAGIAAFSCQGGMASPSGHRGTLHWNPAISTQEVIDPASGEPVADGERGEMVGTPLLNEAEPVFRIATGDEVRFRAPGSCSCGSQWPGIESGTVRRLDAMFKVKGVNLWPAAVDAAVLGAGDVLDYRARIAQGADKRERLLLTVLARDGADDALSERVGSALREATGLSFEVAAVTDRAGWRHDTAGESGKAKRWADERGSVA